MIEKTEIQRNVEEWVIQKFDVSFEFRQYQLDEIIDIIYNIVNTGTPETHIIEAPTGSGKSYINIIAAGVLDDYYGKSSYILCSDLYLWQQYHDTITAHSKLNFGVIKGQTGNYFCNLNGEDVRNSDCRMAGLSWKAMMNHSTCEKYGYENCSLMCEYLHARRRASNANVVMMNYQLFLYALNIPIRDMSGNMITSFPQKDVIFCDECHNIPDIVANQYAAKISQHDFEKLSDLYRWAVGDDSDLFHDTSYDIAKKYTLTELNNELNRRFDTLLDEKMSNKDVAEFINWYAGILYKFTDIVSDIEANIKERKKSGKTYSKDDVKLYKLTSWMRNYMCFWNDFNTAIHETSDEYLLKQVEYTNKTNEPKVILRCLKEDYLVYKYLMSLATNRVLCSATVGGREAFEENIGIKYLTNTETQYDVIPSTFDFTKSPIIFFNRWKMSYREKGYTFPKIMQAVYQILMNKHSNDKGIIQTGSFENAKQLFNNAPVELKRRMLLYDDNHEKNMQITKHKKIGNTILVGPTLCEGIDLPENDCRFIIIMKVPYPSLGDIYVKSKMKLFPHWYSSKTSNTIIQGIGRGVRNENDYCVSYILDACFNSLLNETIEQYSKEFLKRINEFR